MKVLRTTAILICLFSSLWICGDNLFPKQSQFRNETNLYIKTVPIEPVRIFNVADISGTQGKKIIASTRNGIIALDYMKNQVLWRSEKKVSGKAILTSYLLPLVADINKDGIKEIISIEPVRLNKDEEFQDKLTILNSQNGKEIWSKKTGGYIMGIAIGDLNKDGYWEIGFTLSGKRTLYVWDGIAGNLIWKREISGNNYSRPLIADVTGDGKGEIILLAHYYPETKENLFCFSSEGKQLWVFRLAGMSYSSPIAMDFLKNGETQIAVGGSAEYYLLNGKTGQPIWRYKTGCFAGHIFDLWNAGTGYLNQDRYKDIAFVVNGSIHALNGRTGELLWRHPIALPGKYCMGNVLICDLNSDGENEVITGINSEYYKSLYLVSHEGHLLGNYFFPSAPHRGRFFNFVFDEIRKKLLLFAGKKNETLHVLSTDEYGNSMLSFSKRSEESFSDFKLARHKIPSSKKGSCYPTWSPDGKKLAFTSLSKYRILSEKFREKRREIELNIYDISNNQLKIWKPQNGDKYIDMLYPQWIPSSENISVTIHAQKLDKIFRSISIYNEKSGEIHEIYKGDKLVYQLKPFWAKEGLLYIPERDNSLNCFNPVLKKEITKIITGKPGGYFFLPSPSGKNICFVSSTENGSLWLADINGKHIQKLRGNLFTFAHPSWSSDENHIAYCINKDGKNSIQIIELSSGQAKNIVHNEFNNYAPVFSPKKDQLIYCSQRCNDFFIVLLDISKNREYILTKCSVIDPNFSWSPDGKIVAYTDKKEGIQNIYIIKIEDLKYSSSNMM